MAKPTLLVPSSEARIRDAGVIAYYEHLYSYANQLKSVALERGNPVPRIPEGTVG